MALDCWGIHLYSKIVGCSAREFASECRALRALDLRVSDDLQDGYSGVATMPWTG
jgi:hypothetical protein